MIIENLAIRIMNRFGISFKGKDKEILIWEITKAFDIYSKSLLKPQASQKEKSHNNDFKKVCQCKPNINIEVPNKFENNKMVCLNCGKPIQKS